MDIASRLSFQLYSARKYPPLGDQLRVLADLGYRHVEPYGGLLADMGALEAGLKATGLTAPTCHISFDPLRQDVDGFIEKLRRLGTEIAVVPAVHPPLRPTDAEGWRAFGRELSELRRRFAQAGLGLAWHNHDFEFPVVDGIVPMDVILGADPEIGWELDIAWLVRAGEDPLAWMTRYGDRIAAFHVKDTFAKGGAPDEDDWADVGYGTIDWPRLLPAMLKSSSRYFIVEHDNPSDYARFARRSLQTIASW